jgi:hypothetical protein
MSDLVVVLLVLGGYLALQFVILPRLGVPRGHPHLGRRPGCARLEEPVRRRHGWAPEERGQ